jgi:hypothetical protein
MHDSMKSAGMQLFVETMTGTNGQDVGKKIADDMQTLLETAFSSRGLSSAAMHLSRLVGYLEGMGNTLGSLQAAGVGFHPAETKEGRSTLRVTLFPADTSQQPEKPPKPSTDLDKLEGPAYEAALAKMTDAERQKYLESA